MRLFTFLAPKIYPLFPSSAGDTVFGVSIQHALNTRTHCRDFDGTISIGIRSICNGEEIERHEDVVEVKAGKANRDSLWFELNAPQLGYAEVDLIASEPIFHKLTPESGYSLFSGRDGRCLTVNHDTKFAHYRVIEQIKAWRKFCLLHSAVCVDPERSFGNSMLLINPYGGPTVVGLRGPGDTSMRVRVPAKSARMVDLEPVTTVGEFCTVMLSSNNRIVAYDVRHPYGRWHEFNSIDHLDTFSGIATRYQAGLAESLRQRARQSVRRLGLRYV